MGWGAAALAGGAVLGGGAMGWLSGQKQQQSQEEMARASMAFSAVEASKQRDFQERMAGTSHQREVEDLRKAGLNPLLSANAGADSPGGAMGSGAMGSAPTPDVGQMASGAQDAIRLITEWNNSQADRKLKATSERVLHEQEPERRVKSKVWRFFENVIDRYEKNSAKSSSPHTISNWLDPNRNELDTHIETNP